MTLVVEQGKAEILAARTQDLAREIFLKKEKSASLDAQKIKLTSRIENLSLQADRAGQARKELLSAVVVGEKPESEVAKFDQNAAAVQKELSSCREFLEVVQRDTMVVGGELASLHQELLGAREKFWRVLYEEKARQVPAEFKAIVQELLLCLEGSNPDLIGNPIGGFSAGSLQEVFCVSKSERDLLRVNLMGEFGLK